MNIRSIDITKNSSYSAVLLDHALLLHVRYKIRRYLIILIGIVALLMAVFYGARFATFLNPTYVAQALALTPKMVGVLLIFISIFLLMYILEMFFRSYYLEEKQAAGVPTFDVLKIIYGSSGVDLVEGFVRSVSGGDILFRSGILAPASEEFLSLRTEKLFDTPVPEGLVGPITLKDYVATLLASDNEFKTFILKSGARENDILGSAEWVMRQHELEKKEEQWWSRERLATIQGIGKDWSYGEAFTLMRYAYEVVEQYDAYASIMALKDTSEVVSMERILARSQGANAIIVGPNENAARDVVFDFARTITNGTVAPELEHKKIFILDHNTIVSSLKNKDEYEATLLAIFKEAVVARNLILVIPNIPAFISHAHSVGSDIVTLLDPYLSSSQLQIVATIDMDNFHDTIEQNAILVARFEKVVVPEPSEAETIPILERAAENLEAHNKILFTYGAIEEAFVSAENYIPDGVMPDKAVALLVEVVPFCTTEKNVLVERNDILSLIKVKTNVPVGEIQEAEKTKLLSLETLLRERVVGQDEALRVVANALRRARAGVRNMKRPIGSALFIGPTGVGKTETVKALAEIFFGDEKAILRFDMSEYQASDALERLIGFSDGDHVGTLTRALKEKPYGVLLLDEFEKAHKGILDLFLQILDEGFFSDMRGKRVSARNVIIIATSNAGSDLIWEAGQQGVDLVAAKDKVINSVIERGTYKPELLNRFDAVVLFKPLGTNELTQIAHIMLKKLQKRLKEKSLDLVINDELVNAVIKNGMDPMFGARPMNRAIQEKVEQAVAEKLIRGEIREGSQVILSPEELA